MMLKLIKKMMQIADQKNTAIRLFFMDSSFITDKVAAYVAKKLKITHWGSWWQKEQIINFNFMGYVLTIVGKVINVLFTVFSFIMVVIIRLFKFFFKMFFLVSISFALGLLLKLFYRHNWVKFIVSEDDRVSVSIYDLEEKISVDVFDVCLGGSSFLLFFFLFLVCWTFICFFFDFIDYVFTALKKKYVQFSTSQIILFLLFHNLYLMVVILSFLLWLAINYFPALLHWHPYRKWALRGVHIGTSFFKTDMLVFDYLCCILVLIIFLLLIAIILFKLNFFPQWKYCLKEDFNYLTEVFKGPVPAFFKAVIYTFLHLLCLFYHGIVNIINYPSHTLSFKQQDFITHSFSLRTREMVEVFVEAHCQILELFFNFCATNFIFTFSTVYSSFVYLLGSGFCMTVKYAFLLKSCHMSFDNDLLVFILLMVVVVVLFLYLLKLTIIHLKKPEFFNFS